MIAENLDIVEQKICRACARSNRRREDVTLIAVSKTKPVSDILEAYNYGIREFGENKVQEIVAKYDQLPHDIHWHMIGHLQKNKVKYIIDKVSLIHSVDSFELAEEIEKQAEKHNIISDILIEINIADEDTKYGIRASEACKLVDRISEFPCINIHGLMCIAPNVDIPEKNRQYFAELHKISVDITNNLSNNIHMDVLSMGMTGDYEIAVEEGSSMVRVGTGIFGARNYDL